MYQEILKDVIYTAITTLVPLIVTYLVVLGKNKLSQSITKLNNEKSKVLLSRLNSIIGDALIDTANNFTNKLKEEGKWSNEKATEALELSLGIVKAQLTDEMVKLIEDEYKDLETYLKQRITSVYEDNKGMY